MMSEDSELLRQYTENASEEAFRSLVEQHSGMVYGTALRVVRDPHSAQEVTQAVFLLLARKARKLRRGTLLAGWLYRAARLLALETLRADRRRRHRDETFASMNEPQDAASVWERISPLLEDALNRLGAGDREAIVLRFLEGRSFAEMATALGATEPAVKMRVGRAVEKLRARFVKLGVPVSTVTLLAAFSAYGGSPAPAGLSAAVATAALGPAPMANPTLTLLAGEGMMLMTWNKMKCAAIAATVALVVSVTIFVAKHTSALRREPLTVKTFDPMAGEWEGTFAMQGTGFPPGPPQAAYLKVQTTDGGQSCAIEMRLVDPRSQATTDYEFTHTLNTAGNAIHTVDDPRVGRVLSPGKITESLHNPATGEWRAACRSPYPNRGGFTECRWVRQGDSLLISRHDQIKTPQGANDVYSDLKLQRRPGAGAQAQN
jgi:RNA polymerase sigma factor (sigma-70 family)